MTRRSMAAAIALCTVSSLGLSAATAVTPGVTVKTIRIGVHSPLTGAAALPTDKGRKAADLYWKWLQAEGKNIHGRDVEVVLGNDNYNPSQAVAVCKEMVEQDRVFMLSGLLQTGADQMQACARYAESVGVPYVSLGFTRAGLERLETYFAVTMDHPAQARMLADYLVEEIKGRRRANGMLTYDNSNFRGAHDAFVARMEHRDAAVAYDRTVSNTAGTTEAAIVVQEMKAAGIENVFVEVRPTFLIQVLKEADSQGFKPHWTGIGPTIPMFDSILDASCPSGDPSFEGAAFLSPLPAFGDHKRFDPRYERAMAHVYPEDGEGDSAMWLGWSTSKALHRMLELPGKNLTRARFVTNAQGADALTTGILAPFDFTARDHFGGRKVHLLKARCSDRRWHTARSFIGHF